MLYRIGICDDEHSIRMKLTRYINNYFEVIDDSVDIYTWESGDLLIKDMTKNVKLDILFLDIELPDMNGVSIGQHIRNTMADSIVQIVYISYKTSYAMQLFNIHPYDFLVKPVTEEMIADTISSILHISNQDRRFYTYKVNRKIYKVAFGDICYIESNRKHLRIKMSDGDIREYVGKLKDELDRLPDYFVPIGQSYVVNYRHITRCNPDSVVMDNGDRLSISRGYRAQVREKLLSEHSGDDI